MKLIDALKGGKMREIKFRAWNFFNKEMIYRDFFIHGEYGYFKMDGTSLATKNIYLMQYTSLKDKNGKEIYEGDILGGVFNPSYIGFCDKCASFQLMLCRIKYYGPCQQCEGDIQWIEFAHNDYGDIEIIGNIYENPELLEVKS